MRKLILIERSILFTRLAIVLENELTATYLESNLSPDNQDKIIVGQVDKVIKNLNAAFVDYGVEKKGLLHLSQIPDVYKQKLHQGMRLPIQIVKQNEGQKGHKLTAKINLKGKYLVCLPFEKGISVSKKIKHQGLRNKLKEMLKELSEYDYGFIVRTHAEHVPLSEIKEDALRLIEEVNKLMQIKDNLAKGAVLHSDMPMFMQIVAESIHDQEEVQIICDDLEMIQELEELFKESMSLNHQIQLKYFDQKEDLYQIYDLQKEMSALQNRKIWLKNGGNIIIDYTEALTVIDVNSAKAILSNNHRKAVLELNQLAVKEALLQVLRRNLSGIIVIDLVEMAAEEDKEQIYQYAKNMITKLEGKRVTVFPITELGLLQITRTKKYTSVPKKLFAPCSSCSYNFGEFSYEYQAYLLEKRAKSRAYQTVNKEMDVECSKELFDFFMQYNLHESIENKYGIKLRFIKTEKMQRN